MRNAVFLLAVALILVGLVARFGLEPKTLPAAAPPRLGYVVLESRGTGEPVRDNSGSTARASLVAPLPSGTVAPPAGERKGGQSSQQQPGQPPTQPSPATSALIELPAATLPVTPPEGVKDALRSAPSKEPVDGAAAPRAGVAAATAPAQQRPAGVTATKAARPPAAATPASGVAAKAAAPAARPSPEVKEAQMLLSTLGYDAGAADGIDGPRTRSAVRAFKVANAIPADTAITPALLARLRHDASTPEARVAATPVEKQAEEGSWTMLIGAVSYHLGRLFGRDLDSAQRPSEFRAYCRANRDTWVYDRGRDRLVYCTGTSGDVGEFANGTPFMLGR